METSSKDVYDQIHPKETKELIQRTIKQFREGIESPCQYAQSDDFLLLFLRAEVFDVPNALKRYHKYCMVRKRLLDPTDRTSEDLLFELRESEQAVIDAGIVQLLPKPHGPLQRSVIVFRPARMIPKDYEANDDFNIAVWYVLHQAILENENAQKFGIVLLDNLSHYKMHHFNGSSFRRLVSVVQGVLPIRLACIHVCHPPIIVRAILPIVRPFLHERVKKRIKFHPNPRLDLVQPYQFLTEDLPDDILSNEKASCLDSTPTKK